jgi:uncharacterized membrane protein YfcA
LYAGVPAVAANATNTFALWPASLSSTWAYRREIAATRNWLAALAGVSVIGGLLGGRLLVRTSDAGFLRLLPWLMLLAAVTFTFGDLVARRVRRSPRAVSPLALLLQLAIATYGGYFGGGMGIMTLATLSMAGMADIHEMNGVKTALAVLINGASLIEFMLNAAVVWKPGLVMVAGGVVGGYGAAALARTIDQRYVRGLIVVLAWGMTVYFFLR